MQLSTTLYTHRITLFDGKEIDITQRQYNFLMSNQVSEMVELQEQDISFKYSAIQRIEKIRDLEKIREKHQKIEEEKEAWLKGKAKILTKKQSREEAKKHGHEGRAWECPQCKWWNPWLIDVNESGKGYKAVFN